MRARNTVLRPSSAFPPRAASSRARLHPRSGRTVQPVLRRLSPLPTATSSENPPKSSASTVAFAPLARPQRRTTTPTAHDLARPDAARASDDQVWIARAGTSVDSPRASDREDILRSSNCYFRTSSPRQTKPMTLGQPPEIHDPSPASIQDISHIPTNIRRPQQRKHSRKWISLSLSFPHSAVVCLGPTGLRPAIMLPYLLHSSAPFHPYLFPKTTGRCPEEYRHHPGQGVSILVLAESLCHGSGWQAQEFVTRKATRNPSPRLGPHGGLCCACLTGVPTKRFLHGRALAASQHTSYAARASAPASDQSSRIRPRGT
jgi:hypothetical protein